MAKARTLVDNFNDNAIDPALWTTVIGSTDVRETNGRVEFRPFGNVSGGGGWYQSQALYDLQDSGIHVELVRQLRPVSGVMAFAGTQSSNYDSLQVRVNGPSVHCIVYTTAGGLVRVAELPYDPAHRWLRIRSEGDTVFWEGSPDCREWSTYHAAPRPFDLTAMRLQFGVWMEVNVPAPGTAVFDNFNVQDTSLSRRVEERRLSARDLRIEAAEVDAARLHDEHHNNNDEVNYPTSPLTGNFSKGLRHDNLGNPDPVS